METGAMGPPVLEESDVPIAQLLRGHTEETINGNFSTGFAPSNTAMRMEVGNAAEMNFNSQMKNNDKKIILQTGAPIEQTFPPPQELSPVKIEVQGLPVSDSGHLVTSHTTAASFGGEDYPELDASQVEDFFREMGSNSNQPMMESSNHVTMEMDDSMKEVKTADLAVTFEECNAQNVWQTSAPAKPTFAASHVVQEFMPMKNSPQEYIQKGNFNISEFHKKQNDQTQMGSQTTAPVTQIFAPFQELPMKNEVLGLVASNSRHLTIPHTTAAMVENSSKAKVENLNHVTMELDGPMEENGTSTLAVQVKTTELKLIQIAAVKSWWFWILSSLYTVGLQEVNKYLLLWLYHIFLVYRRFCLIITMHIHSKLEILGKC